MSEFSAGMKHGFHGWTSSNILRHFFELNVAERTGATKRIITQCVGLYIENTLPAQRQIDFHQARDETDVDQIERATRANTQLIRRYLNPDQSTSLRDELGHYLAQSMDEPYRTECIRTIKTKFWDERRIPDPPAAHDQRIEFREFIDCANSALNKTLELLFDDGVIDGDDCPDKLQQALNKLNASRRYVDEFEARVRAALEQQKPLKVVGED